MKKLPPRLSLNTPTGTRYYLGRIDSVKDGFFHLTLWEGSARGPELWSSVRRRGRGTSKEGKLGVGTPIELWTWSERRSGRNVDRVHIRSIEKVREKSPCKARS